MPLTPPCSISASRRTKTTRTTSQIARVDGDVLEGRQEQEVLGGGDEVGEGAELAVGVGERQVDRIAGRRGAEQQQQDDVRGDEYVAGAAAPPARPCRTRLAGFPGPAGGWDRSTSCPLVTDDGVAVQLGVVLDRGGEVGEL